MLKAKGILFWTMLVVAVFLTGTTIALGAEVQVHSAKFSLTELLAIIAAVQVALRFIAEWLAKFADKTKSSFDNKAWKVIVWVIDLLGWVLGIFGAGAAKTSKPRLRFK